MNKRRFDSLPRDLQRILKQESKAIGGYWRGLYEQRQAANVESMKRQGVSFTEIDFASFRRAMDPIYASFQNQLGRDLVERVIRIAGG
jgi:TRAP-type C4-dicarboxylate transport system substrate-binding protein